MAKWWLILSLCGLHFQGAATQMRPLSIEQLTQKAQLVLRGTVSSKTCQRDPEGRIYTRIELQVQDAWKGSPKANPFSFVQGGGVLGEQQVNVAGQEEFTPGEEVVVFLVLNAREEGVIVGISQGKFRVATDPVSGQQHVSNLFHGARSSVAEGSASPPKRPLWLTDLKRQVQGGGR